MLSQTQLLIASQLFIAAGKAGQPFDLSKFSHDRSYAMQTLGELASRSSDPAVLELVAKAALALTDAEAPKPVAAAQSETVTNPIDPDDALKRYVGRLR
jgi:hypothetical protein